MKTYLIQRCCFAVCIGILMMSLFPSGISRAEDWPQWRGAQRDGVWRETGILNRIPAKGLVTRWRVRIGQGYSGPVVADGRVFVTDRKSNPDVERVLCFEQATGKPLWKYVYPCEYAEMEYGNGPRAAPTVHEGRVYTLGTKGHLFCFSADEGKIIWKKDLVKDYRAIVPRYGVSAAPLVEGDLLIVCAGAQPDGTVIAFDKRSGEERWKALPKDRPAYSAPIALTAGGCRQVIVWTADYVSSLKPETGEVYWQVRYKATFDEAQVVTSPVLQGDRLLCLAAWYRGSFMLQLNREKPAVSEVWRTRKAPSVTFATPFFPEGNYFYGVLNDGKLACLDAATGKEIWSTDKVTGSRNGTAHITPNGNRVFLFNQRGQLILAKLSPEGYEELGRCLLVEPTAGYRPQQPITWAHPAYANQSIFARNDKELVCASLSATDVPDKPKEEIPGLKADLKFTDAFGKEDPIQSLAVSPDGKLIAGGSWRGSVKLVEWESAKILPAPTKHRRTITSLAFSPGGKLLVSAGGNAFYSGGNNYEKDAEVRLWDVAGGNGLGKLDGHTDKVLTVAFSPDGETIASGAMDHTVRLWDVKTMKQRALLEGHGNSVSSITFSPDGKTLASADWDGVVRFWDPVTGDQQAELKAHEEEIMCLAFSPDGKLLATGGADWMVNLWDPNTKELKNRLKGHGGTVYSLAFSPDGKTLATGGGDQTARLWDLRAGKERMTLQGHESGITSLVFAADGKSLLTTGRDDGMKWWSFVKKE